MGTPPRSPEELIEASQHLLYEYDMLNVTALGLASGIGGESSPLNNALLESFVIHARNLLHFFFPEQPYATDVLAQHYFPTPAEWVGIRGDMPEVLADVRSRANKEMAHLTYDRLLVDDKSKHWQYLDILAALKEIMARLVQNVPPDLLHQDWQGWRSVSSSPTEGVV